MAPATKSGLGGRWKSRNIQQHPGIAAAVWLQCEAQKSGKLRKKKGLPRADILISGVFLPATQKLRSLQVTQAFRKSLDPDKKYRAFIVFLFAGYWQEHLSSL